MARVVSTGVASAVLAGLLSTVSFVSPPTAGAAEDGTPVVPSQSLGSVPAQGTEEVGKPLPAPQWPPAGEASIDLSQAAAGEAGTVSPAPSPSSSGDAETQVSEVVEVAPAPVEDGALTPQLSTVQRLSNASASPTPSASDQAEATAADDEATPSGTASPEAEDASDEEPGDTDPVSPDQVDVRVLDRKDVEPAGGIGLGLQVTRTDGATVPGPVQVDIDYSGFKYAFGGDFANRLQLVKLPACALTTPEQEGCAKREVVSAENDTAAGTLTATVTAEPETAGVSTQTVSSTSGSVYTLATGSSSDKGDYRASTLSPTGSWSVATGSGAFNYSLPVQLPKPPMGEAPSLAMTYNSQSVDGRTSASNNQASWVGMGWDLGVGFIERRYRNCSQDGLPTIGDMCWDSPNSDKEPSGAVYVINLNGVSSELIQDENGTGSYHVKDDPGWRVQRLTGGYGAGRDDEYWVISSQDGHRYYFGWGRSERTETATGSVFTMPVVGNDVGEPCHDQFPEPCTQAYRWNLDRVVDANEVESIYFYDKEYNHYRSVANTDKPRSYVSSGYLKEIQYGWASQVTDSKVPAKVVLTHVNRCVERMSEADPLRNAAKTCPTFKESPSSYPDVPIDLMCDGTSADYNCAGKTYYPTFFSTDMLWDITTYVLDQAGSGWDTVQQFQTKHGLPNPDGTIGKTLWFDYLQRRTYGNGTNLVLPVINFNGVDLDNKVGSTELNFRRVSEIHGDTGATTTVTYGSANACDASSLPSQASNTTDCYWQKWTPEGETEAKTGWFRKYLVKKVEVDPTVTTNQDGAPVMTTTYDYQGGAGWRFTSDPLMPDDDESWSDWRGYQEVEVTTGSGVNKRSTKHWLYRGLDGDRTSKTDALATKSVSVNDGYGGTYTDSDWLSGQTVSTSTRDDQGTGREHTIYSYWTHNTAQYDGMPDARFVRQSKAVTSTLLADSTWREHVVEQEYDDSEAASTTFGLAMRTDDWGQSDVSDNQCTTYGRAYNTDDYDSTGAQRWTVLQDQAKHYRVGCSSITDDYVDGYTSTLYDNAATVADNHPADGNPTEIRTYTASGKYRTVNAGYDKAGRTLWNADGKGNRTTTAYSPANTWPTDGVTVTTPDPDGAASVRGPLTSKVWTSRFWGLPYQSQDANGNITKITLDAAGRITEVWKPTETGSSPSMKFAYTIPTSTNGSGVPDAVDGYPHVTSSVLQSGSTYLTSHAYTDALGRARETQVPLPSADGKAYRQVTATRYDSAGNVAGTSDTFRNQGTAGQGGPSSPQIADLPSYTDVVADWAGRTTLSQLVALGVTQAKGKVTTTYNGEKTTVQPAVGAATDSYTDVYGKTSKVVEHSESSTYTTTYGYTRKGELAQITDTRGNVTTYGYDWAGGRIAVDDPDAGVSTTLYDANGNIQTVTGNAGKTTVSYAYDNLNRKTGITSGSNEFATLTWDLAADNTTVTGGKNQVIQATSRDADGTTYTTKTNAFDARGRATSTTVTLPSKVTGLAGSYTTTVGYDAADHITTVGYPAAGGLPAETVTTDYNAYGQPTRSTSSNGAVYVNDTTYDAYDRVKARTYAAPAGTPGANGVSAVREYGYHDSDATRWLQKISTKTNVNTLIAEQQVDTYSYDNAGRITELREQASGQTAQSQCFTYDAQTRLEHALTTTAASCAGVTTSDFKGTAPYQSDYTYDRIGNLQSVTDTNAAGQATKRDHLYPGYDDSGTWTTANADQPHGIRKTNHIVGGTTTSSDTLTYNPDGTMLKRIEPGTGTSTAKTTDYTWTPLGRLATVTTTKSTGSELTRYTYDADGNLLVRTNPAATVAYLGATEVTTTDGKTVTATRYYTCGTATVAMRTTNSDTGKVTYLTVDNQASTQLAIDAGTGTTTRRRYTPFGDERSGTLPAGTDHGFLGKTEDTTAGLSLLGARAYDPALGRFLSPDPLIAPYEPQNLSSYSYSHNDPINFSDPTGMREECAWTGDPCPRPHVLNTGGGGGQEDASLWTIALGESAGVAEGFVETGDSLSIACWIDDEFCAYDGNVETVHEAMEFLGADTTANQYWWAVGHGNEAAAVAGAGKVIAAARALSKRAAALRACAGGNSFTPETEVELADGDTKKIADLKTGDNILATDPETGTTEARAVLATIIGSGKKDLTELTIDTGRSDATIIATSDHPFWSPSQGAWLDAADLKPGMTLQTDTSDTVTLQATRNFRQQQKTRNLTIDGLHTYYVLAGETPVLVHNSNGLCGTAALENGDWQHILDRHRPGGAKVDAKSGIFTGKAKHVRGRIAETINRGTPRPNTPDPETGRPRAGQIYEWDFGVTVGRAGPANGGGELTGIRVVVNDGKVVTAFPF
jgi:RHS repeat-associated protein